MIIEIATPPRRKSKSKYDPIIARLLELPGVWLKIDSLDIKGVASPAHKQIGMRHVATSRNLRINTVLREEFIYVRSIPTAVQHA